jgi:hypothetical protein
MYSFAESARAKYQAAKRLKSKALAPADHGDDEAKVHVIFISTCFSLQMNGVPVPVCVCVRERERVCVCVCVCF